MPHRLLARLIARPLAPRRSRRATGAPVPPLLEPLESRSLLSVALVTDLPGVVFIDNAAGAVAGSVGYTALQTAQGPSLWRTDGTAGGTVKFKQFDAQAAGPISHVVPVGAAGRALLGMSLGASNALWVTDGTDAGTLEVPGLDVALLAAPFGFATEPFAAVGSTVFFVARDADHGQELWKSDGTLAGTVLVKDINPASNPAADPPALGSDIRQLVVVGSTLFFIANDGVNGEQLWKSDGTPEGTVIVEALNPNAEESNFGFDVLLPFNNQLLFQTYDVVGGLFTEFTWLSDGTPEGTSTVPDFDNVFITQQARFAPLGNSLFISGVENLNGPDLNGLYFTNLTLTGTEFLLPQLTSDALSDLITLGDALYFSQGVGSSLWTSDGTAAGTGEAFPIGTGGEAPHDPLAHNGRLLYFARSSPSDITNIYSTDGSPQGTRRLSNFDAAVLSDQVGMRILNGDAYTIAPIPGSITMGLWRIVDDDSDAVLLLDGNLALSAYGQPIAAGDTSPADADLTDFGDVQARSQANPRTFTLTNTGLGPIDLTGAKVQLMGAHAGDFVLTPPAASTLAPGATATFTLAFKPTRLGLRSATVRVTSTDPDTPAYEFAIQGRTTTNLFIESEYLSLYPDVAAGVGPSKFFKSGYDHFAAAGQSEGRRPNRLFDPAAYLLKNPDVAAGAGPGKAFKSGFEHFAFFGQAEGRRFSPYYDEATYLARNPDVAASVGVGNAWASGLAHFLAFGRNEGRQFSPYFDEQLYRFFNPDVAAAVGPGKAWRSGFDHFLAFGLKEHRRFSALYDEAVYLARNADVAAAVGPGKVWASGLDHFKAYGFVEGRRCSNLYVESIYLQKNPDVAAGVGPGKTYLRGLEHFLLFGWREGRAAI